MSANNRTSFTVEEYRSIYFALEDEISLLEAQLEDDTWDSKDNSRYWLKVTRDTKRKLDAFFLRVGLNPNESD